MKKYLPIAVFTLFSLSIQAHPFSLIPSRDRFCIQSVLAVLNGSEAYQQLELPFEPKPEAIEEEKFLASVTVDPLKISENISDLRATLPSDGTANLKVPRTFAVTDGNGADP